MKKSVYLFKCVILQCYFTHIYIWRPPKIYCSVLCELTNLNSQYVFYSDIFFTKKLFARLFVTFMFANGFLFIVNFIFGNLSTLSVTSKSIPLQTKWRNILIKGETRVVFLSVLIYQSILSRYISYLYVWLYFVICDD